MHSASLCAPLLLLFGGAFLASCASASLNTTTIVLSPTTVTTKMAVNTVSISGTSAASPLSIVTNSALSGFTTKTTNTKSAAVEEVTTQKQAQKKVDNTVDVKTITTTTVVLPTSVGSKTTMSATKSTSTVKTATRIATLKTATSAQTTTMPTATTTNNVPETTITTISSVAPITTTTTTTAKTHPKSPMAFVVADDEDSSQDVTTTTVGANRDDVPASFPHFIHHSQFGTKVRLCTCNETDHCANEAFIHLDACKRRCVVTLEEYNRVEPEELMECFPEMDEELMALERCVRSNVNNICSKDDSAIVYIDPPPRGVGTAAAAGEGNATSLFSYFAVSDPLEGVSRHGVQVKKARKTFIRLRSYQKCTARCVLEKSVSCQHESKCVTRLPPVYQLDLILAECEGTKFYKHSHDSCKCMVHTKRVRKLIGICPFMLNRAVLRRL